MQINKSFFLNNLLFGGQGMDLKDRIAQKKQMAMKDAMHVVTTADKGEKKIDQMTEEHMERVRRLQDDTKEAHVRVKELNQQMDAWKENCGIGDDSQEQKDLELLQKAYDIEKQFLKGGSAEELTEEEQERLANMGEMTEYQRQAMELYKEADYWKTKMSENQDEMAVEGKAIRAIKIDRLKSHAMADAQNAKEQILDAASKEIIGMIKDEAKDTIDEKMEELKEAAEKRKEKEEELEEQIEAAREKKSEAEEAAEEVRENIDEMTEIAAKNDNLDLEDEIKKIMEEEKLLLEDLKGLSIDAGA